MRNGLVTLLLCAFAAVPPPSHAIDVQYQVTQIPLPAEANTELAWPADMNNNGVVVGTMRHWFGTDVYTNFRFDSRTGTLTRTGYMYENYGGPTASNDNGAIVGSFRSESTTTSGYFRPSFEGPSSQLQALPYPPIWWYTVPHAINNSNQIVGQSQNADNKERAVLWNSPNDVQDLGTLGGNTSIAHGINDQGVVTGTAEIVPFTGRSVAFVYENGEMHALNGLENTLSTGYAINEAGDIVGRFYTGNEWHAFAYLDGAVSAIDVPGSSESEALDINESGWVVGTARKPGSTERFGFLYAGGEAIDLTTLAPAGWTVTQATDITDNGEILAELCQGSTCSWGVLTPVPEPAAWGMLATGLPALAIVARRRRATTGA